jgi:tRNA/rRNA methyltransferase
MRVPPPIVIFVRPQAQGNIGAIARIMSNFGIRELRLVNRPHSTRDMLERYGEVDWILACKGQALLDSAPVYASLKEALHDCEVALSSSGRPRDSESGYSRPTVSVGQAMVNLQHWMAQKGEENLKWALVIGPEDDGLSEDEVALCRQLINIPTSSENPSMNAAMATGCMLYHWYALQSEAPRADARGPFPETKGYSEAGRKDWATMEQTLGFADYLMESLELTSFMKYPDKAAVLARIQRWVQVAPIPVGELLFAFEILYQFRSKIEGSFSERNFLKSRKG